MRATKPEDERFFKDIVLNSILKEIAHENGTNLHTMPSNSKKRFHAKFVWIPLIALVTIFWAAIPQSTPNSTPDEQAYAKQAPKPEPQIAAPNIQTQHPSIQKDQTTFKTVAQPEHATPMNEHEQAKADLLRQMKE